MRISNKEHDVVRREITYLRKGHFPSIDRKSNDRHSVSVKEPWGRTVYCFTTPIYGLQSQRLVRPQFKRARGGYRLEGTCGSVTVCGRECTFENGYGRVTLTLPSEPSIAGFYTSEPSDVAIYPTPNGVRMTLARDGAQMLLGCEPEAEEVRSNGAYFALMCDRFQPSFSIATLYACRGDGKIAPVRLARQERGAGAYSLSFSHGIRNGSFCLEANLYEPKLVQDTTVSSALPKKNNAFGAVAFLGRTEEFGEQWLYTRPNFSRIDGLTGEKIEKVLLHIPIFGGHADRVEVLVPERRFCSFGSTWEKKVAPSVRSLHATRHGRYLTVDVTEAFTDRFSKRLTYNEGLILRRGAQDDGCIAISTGDCYSAPQILEIKIQGKEVSKHVERIF